MAQRREIDAGREIERSEERSSRARDERREPNVRTAVTIVDVDAVAARARSERRRSLIGLLSSRAGLRQAMLLHEILGPPVSERGVSGDRFEAVEGPDRRP